MKKEFKPFSFKMKELSLLEGYALWGAGAVVQPQGHKLVLEELHETHTVVSKMKTLARSYVWWPGMDAEIEEVIRNCSS